MHVGLDLSSVIRSPQRLHLGLFEALVKSGAGLLTVLSRVMLIGSFKDLFLRRPLCSNDSDVHLLEIGVTSGLETLSVVACRRAATGEDLLCPAIEGQAHN